MIILLSYLYSAIDIYCKFHDDDESQSEKQIDIILPLLMKSQKL